MKVGDRVCCSQYIKRSGNHYVVYKPEETLSGIEEAVYCENGVDEKEAVDGEHSCALFKIINKHFTGIFVGTTALRTILECSYEEPPYREEGFYFRKSESRKFAVVYYANNKKRLVPLSAIKEATSNESYGPN